VAAFTQQWARFQNGGVLIPKLPYSINAKATFDDFLGDPAGGQDVHRDAQAWAFGYEDSLLKFISPGRSPRNNVFQVMVEEGRRPFRWCWAVTWATCRPSAWRPN